MLPHAFPTSHRLVRAAFAAIILVFAVSFISSPAQAKQLQVQSYAPQGTVGIFYNTVLVATGGTSPYTFSATGIPSGLTINATTGSITGTPQTSGNFSVTATVKDASSAKSSATFAIEVYKSGTIGVVISPDSSALVSGATQKFTASVYNSSNQNVTWSCSAGTITSSGLYTAPQVQSGTWTYRVWATSAADPTKSSTAVAIVTPNVAPLTITTTSLPSYEVGTQYSQSVNVTGGKSPYHWKLTTGTLPKGITFTNSTGVFAGNSGQTGAFPLTVTVTDSSWPTNLTATQSYSLVGTSALSVSTTTLPQITAGSSYDTAVVAVGGMTPYQWSLSSGSLPTGISLSGTSGAISGTTQQTGQYTLTVRVTDSSSPQQSATAQYTVQSVQGQSTVADFYVATNGKDTWSGTLAAPNSNNTDGPFASIARAQTAVQAILKNPNGRTKTIQVLVRAGTYYLTQALNFTSADSGTASLQVNWSSYPNETPVISGGVRITNWTHGAGNQWTTTLSSSTQYFEQLFYNGQRRLRPRLGGYMGTYYRIAATVYLPSNSDPNCSVYMPGLGWECFDRFVYSASDPISSTWENLNAPYPQGDIELYDFEKWTASELRIKSIDTRAHIVYLTGPTDQQDNYHGMIAGHRYVVENLKDAFSQPGQWFLDRSKTPWTLTYLANSGENPATDTVIIPQMTQVLIATGLKYVTFQGLTFEHDNWTVPIPQGYPAVTSDQGVSGAFGCYNCSNVTLNGVIVTQTQGGGVEFFTTSPSSTTAHNTIENSAFYDLGAFGIRYGLLAQYTDTDANVAQFGTVENNVVAGFGRVTPSGFGISQGDGHDNLYTHNEVYDGFQGGVKVCALGCIPGVSGSHGAFNNVVSFNHIYNLGEGILDDLGAVYFNTDPASTGNQVLNNRIHDIDDASGLDADGYAGQGIYLDANTANVLVQNNLVYRTTAVSQAQTCGPQNAHTPNNIVNNIFAYGRNGIKQEGCVPPKSGVQQFNFSNNLIYYNRGYVQTGYVYCMGQPCTEVQNYHNNMYCYAGSANCALPTNPFFTTGTGGRTDSVYYASLQAWQNATGEDSGSVVQNPGFANPVYPDDDYTLKESPGVGFVVFDPKQAGRTNPVIVPPAVIGTFTTAPFNPATDF
ncbi:MAG: putative Ig domain-containing protein [Candidatus Sulfotelmatobacter sp.]